MKFSQLFLLQIILLLVSCGPKIVNSPIVFNEERKALTLDYMKEHYGIDQDSPTIVPRMVVVHWTAIPSYGKTFEVFDKVTLSPSRTAISGAGNLNVSSQYLIDRDGTIHQLMPDTIMARHVIGLNHCATGIENVGGTKAPLTKAQLKANTKLIKQLKKKYPIEYVIGHFEYTLFEDTDLWLEKDEGYRTVKTDPGEEFMEALRKKLKSLHLKPLPQQNKQ